MSNSTPNRALAGSRTAFYANPDSPIASTPQRGGPVSRLNLRSVNSVSSSVASPQRPQNTFSQFATSAAVGGQLPDTPKRLSNAIFSPALPNNPYGGQNNRVEEYALPSSPSAAATSHLSQLAASQQHQTNMYRQQNAYLNQYLSQYKRQTDDMHVQSTPSKAQTHTQAAVHTPSKTIQSPQAKAAAPHSPAMKKHTDYADDTTSYGVSAATTTTTTTSSETEYPQRNMFTETDHLLFIKQLPEYKLVVPHPPPALLPPKSPMAPRFNLVLDLDETLVHCSITPLSNPDFTFTIDCDGKEFEVYARMRPYLNEFFEAIHGRYEVTLFTASQQVYAEALLRIIDPQNKYIQNKLYRDACLNLDGNFLKDLNALGRDLRETVLVDNAPYVFGYQVDNGIPIESWYDDPNDDALLHLPKFLEHLRAVPDVRPVIREHFRLQHKLDALSLSDFYPDYDDHDGTA